MVKAKTATVDVWKKKKWYMIYAPKAFNELFLGETPALEPEQVKGRCVESSLMLLLGDLKKQGYAVTFRINEVKDNRALTEAIKYEIKPYAIRKFIRKGCTRIDDSFMTSSGDNKLVRVKPFTIITKRISNSLQTQVRKAVSDVIIREFKKTGLNDLLADIALGKFQKIIYDKIKKIAPVRITELRVVELVESVKKAKKLREESNEKPGEAEEEVISELEGAAELPEEEQVPENTTEEQTEEQKG